MTYHHLKTLCASAHWGISMAHAKKQYLLPSDGDTDTKGAITGSIAEAYYEIPDEIIDKALSYLPKDMLDIVTQFCDTVIKVIDD